MAGGSGRPYVHCKLESDKVFGKEFVFAGIPLTRGMEIKETDYEPQFMEGIYGYVKACFKLNDGFVAPPKDDSEDEGDDLEAGLSGFFSIFYFF